MPTTTLSREDLWAITHEHNHVQQEHARATSDSVRRKLEARLRALEERFEHALEEAVPAEGVRRAWREHLHHRGPAPAEPRETSPLLFRGRSEVGSEVVARQAPGGEIAFEVDGKVTARRPALDVTDGPGGASVTLDDLPRFEETFTAPREAIEALQAWLAQPGQEPPWRWARDLVAEGLIDHTFALTPRGQRALGTLG